MSIQPVEITLDLAPRSRFEIIDVAHKLTELYGDLLWGYRKSTCISFHTTAGYLEQQLCARLGHDKKRLDRFISIFKKLFPPNAGYFHDRLELRDELNDTEKEKEPLNADSHLTFISAGLKNCVTYINEPKLPIYFIDLDGVYKNYRRKRKTTILAYNREEIVYRGRFYIPVPGDHAINSFNLRDPRYGLFSHLNELMDSCGIDKGSIDISLGQDESQAALTVNEYETMLMRNDLPDALRNPLRYLLRRTIKLLSNPTSIPGKTRSYFVYDLVHLYNELMEKLRLNSFLAEKVSSSLSVPMTRIFCLKKGISLMVSRNENGTWRILQGKYQSPILLQYRSPKKGVRCLQITVKNFE